MRLVDRCIVSKQIGHDKYWLNDIQACNQRVYMIKVLETKY